MKIANPLYNGIQSTVLCSIITPDNQESLLTSCPSLLRTDFLGKCTKVGIIMYNIKLKYARQVSSLMYENLT